MSEPRDAHATARARDARPWRGSTFAEAATDIVQGLASLRTRTHAINPTTGEFTRLDQESDTMTDHRADAERALSSIDASDDPRNLPAGLDGIGNALLAIHDTFAAIHDTLTEIRDRLPERVEARVAPFDPDLAAANIAALKHELETPMRGHGECCEPEPADDPDEAHERQEHGPGTFGYCSERRARKKAEAALADMTRQRDEYATEAERWQARHAALRVDLVQEERTRHYGPLSAILDRDDERGAR